MLRRLDVDAWLWLRVVGVGNKHILARHSVIADLHFSREQKTALSLLRASDS